MPLSANANLINHVVQKIVDLNLPLSIEDISQLLKKRGIELSFADIENNLQQLYKQDYLKTYQASTIYHPKTGQRTKGHAPVFFRPRLLRLGAGLIAGENLPNDIVLERSFVEPTMEINVPTKLLTTAGLAKGDLVTMTCSPSLLVITKQVESNPTALVISGHSGNPNQPRFSFAKSYMDKCGIGNKARYQILAFEDHLEILG